VLYEGVPDDFSSGISPFEPSIPTFLHVGGPPRKGTTVFLDALAKLNSRGLRMFGVITRARGCDQQKILELEVPVTTYRFLDTLSYRKLLASCTALVCSSYSEGFCLPIVEAAMFGKPSIVTDTGSLPELITDGQNGFVVPVGDVTALADRMYKLTKDAELRKRMRTNAVEFSKRFTISKASLDLLSLIQLAITNREPNAHN
jgi:glycosyltransferase involved in cell wall biosynthesis